MTKPRRHAVVILLMAAGWSLLGTTLAVLILYIPGALDVVDDYKLGRGVVMAVPPSLFLMAAAGLCAGLRKYVPAVVITALVLLGCAALDAMIIVRAPGL